MGGAGTPKSDNTFYCFFCSQWFHQWENGWSQESPVASVPKGSHPFAATAPGCQEAPAGHTHRGG